MAQDASIVEKQHETFEEITQYLKELKPEKIHIHIIGNEIYSPNYSTGQKIYCYKIEYFTINPKDNEAIELNCQYRKESSNNIWNLVNTTVLRNLAKQVNIFEQSGIKAYGDLIISSTHVSNPMDKKKFTSSSDLEKLARESFDII